MNCYDQSPATHFYFVVFFPVGMLLFCLLAETATKTTDIQSARQRCASRQTDYDIYWNETY